ncbi:PREDICTED: splicing factor 3A subunit 2-like [Ceratotherium simum simum]|uniref:Splicing factor 3A subunit 2-like n=1 Tax=Ceratotherium simum simum TaxID=73337 RepID=A0ABM1D0L6_CERSS|nr:PREDICTED: splicing factor 3A subunit 2-like [Ceratotherium simum simum]
MSQKPIYNIERNQITYQLSQMALERRGRPKAKTTSEQGDTLTWVPGRPSARAAGALGALSSPGRRPRPPPALPAGGQRPSPPGAPGERARARGTVPGGGSGPGVAESEPPSTLAQVARRGLRTERVNNLPGHLPTSALSPELASSAPPRPAVEPEEPLRHPPQPGAQGFCFGRDENNDP